MTDVSTTERVLREVEDGRDELLAFAAELIRIPTVNPPGADYETCAYLLGERLDAWGMEVEYLTATDRPEHSAEHPRVNVVGRWQGGAPRPCVHLNGHFDVVPPGEGWTVDPFAGLVRDGRLWGRGAADMKSGLAAAAFAVEALRRAGVRLGGAVEVSGTVDEESGGFAGVGHLCEVGRLSAERTDYVIIPEPFGPDRVCLGHRGVYWFDVTAHGRVAHGSMPHLGRSAIGDMAAFLESVRTRLEPELSGRVSEMAVVPEESRRASINVNALQGGQAGYAEQSPCVADLCVATFDRRFLPEEALDDVRAEISDLVAELHAADPGRRYLIEERMVVRPTRTADDARLVRVLCRAVERVRGAAPALVGSPGTYDHKHVARVAGVRECVAYGPGPLEEAHQPDESCAVDDLVAAAQVLALAVLELAG